MSKGRLLGGLILILVGGSILLDNLFGIRIWSVIELWPIIILGLGLGFEYSYFSQRSKPGLLVPGGILSVLGGTMLLNSVTGWRFAEYTGPMSEIAVAFGLFQLYWFGERKRGLLIPVFILSALAVIQIFYMTFGRVLTPFMMRNTFGFIIIAVGLLILMANFRKKNY